MTATLLTVVVVMAGGGSRGIARRHSNGIIILNVCMFALNDREANGVL